jgi:hypothetical protein
MTMQSELKRPNETVKSGIVVEYGPVTIGERVYVCPVKSEAFSTLSSSRANGRTKPADSRFVTFLNDVTFTEYHVFRAEVRVLP